MIPSLSSAETVVMDPVVWGSLQHHISLLENVYLRLPLREQLQLRGVCKEWNAIASQRRCNTDVIRKPFFVVAVQDESESFGRYTVVGILTFHVASGCWRWTRLCTPAYALEPMSVPFSVEGIVFTTWGEIFPCFVDAYQHPPQHHGISRASPNFWGKASGMAVRAPHSFQFILGQNQGTRIYDSATWLWERRPSRMPHVERPPTACKACLHFGDEVFIWSQVDTIFVYSLKGDVWSVLETPPLQEPGAGGALGAWDGRVFLFSCLSLWELVDRAKPTWRRFAHVPADIHAWLVPPCFPDGNYKVRVYASFSQEYVLIHTLVCESGAPEGMTKRFVLFNLATHKWEKEEMCAVKANPQEKRKDGLWDESVDCFTEDRQGIRPLFP